MINPLAVSALSTSVRHAKDIIAHSQNFTAMNSHHHTLDFSPPPAKPYYFSISNPKIYRCENKRNAPFWLHVSLLAATKWHLSCEYCIRGEVVNIWWLRAFLWVKPISAAWLEKWCFGHKKKSQRHEVENLKSSVGSSSAAGGQRYQHLHPNSEIANGYWAVTESICNLFGRGGLFTP